LSARAARSALAPRHRATSPAPPRPIRPTAANGFAHRPGARMQADCRSRAQPGPAPHAPGDKPRVLTARTDRRRRDLARHRVRRHRQQGAFGDGVDPLGERRQYLFGASSVGS
jgi:hypothetical protein